MGRKWSLRSCAAWELRLPAWWFWCNLNLYNYCIIV
jgi:hypothetical protein